MTLQDDNREEMSELYMGKVYVHTITQKTLDLFIKRLKEHEKDNLSRVILFGSVARGEANEDSDIDVLVVLKESDFDKRMEICDVTADVMWDMDFDNNAYLQPVTISEKQSNGVSYCELMLNINKEGVILYDAKE